MLRAAFFSTVWLAAVLACTTGEAQQISRTIESGSYTSSRPIFGTGDDGSGDNGKDRPNYDLIGFGAFTVGGNQKRRPLLEGEGGDQNSGVGDPRVGNSGDAKNILITDRGSFPTGSISDSVRGLGYAWGIAALGRGHQGGQDNGQGVTGHVIEIRNIASISIYWNGGDDHPAGWAASPG